MKNYKPQTERFEKFSDLVEAAASRYTLSYRDACKALKCSRKWADEYIRPNVPFIYLQNGKETGKANYARIVSLAVNKMNDEENTAYSNESVYLDETAFNTFVTSSISSCQKRTKAINKTYFVKPEKLNAYLKNAIDLYLKIIEEKNPKELEQLYQKFDSLYLQYAKNEFVQQYIPTSIVYKTKRTDADFVNVPYPSTSISEWKAVHDIMDYGDIEETIYRDLFKEGCIRIEIKIPDKNGEIKNKGKVYYIDDPDYIPPFSLSPVTEEKLLKSYTNEEDKEAVKKIIQSICRMDRINIKQNAWIKYNNMLGKSITY